MPNLRTIITTAVPAVAALLGLLWYFSRRKQPVAKRLVDPPDKSDKEKLSSQTKSSTSDNGEVISHVLNCEVSNGQAGKSGSNIHENPISNSSLEPTSHESDSDGKGDKILLSSAAPSLHRDINVTDSGDARSELSNEPVEDLIKVVEAKPSFAEPCSSDMKHKVDSINLVDDSRLSETANTPLQLIEESIITSSKVENVLVAPECSSPKPEQTRTAEVSQEVNDKIDSESLQLNTLNTTGNVSDNFVLNENEKEKGASEAEDLNKKEDIFSASSVEQIEPLTRSWHEEVSENMADLNEDFSADSVPEIGKSEQSLDSSSSTIDKAESSKKTERIEDDNLQPVSNDQNLSVDSTVEGLQSSPLSKTGLQTEKTESNHSDSSSNCDNLSEASNDSGKGGSVQENTGTSPPDEDRIFEFNIPSPPDEDRIFEFNIPSDLCGLFIGTRGKTIKMISQQSGSKIRLQNNPYTRDFQICVIEGSQSAIDTACNIIRRKFPAIKYPGMDLTPTANPVIMPEIMQLSLPEGVSVDIVVSSIVDAGRIFVQQPTHPTYPSLDRLNTFMSQCYMQEGSVPDIPRPIEAGVICAAPMLNGWYRAQIMASHEGSDECDIKYVDYGGYSRVSSLLLKQIRSDFMTLPFEAIECYLANITPLENEQYYSTEAAVVLEELTQGKLLQGQVVGRAEDGIPYVHVYQILGANSAVLVNREMVNRGVVRWQELME